MPKAIPAPATPISHRGHTDRGNRIAIGLAMLLALMAGVLAWHWLAANIGDYLVAFMLSGVVLAFLTPTACSLFGCDQRPRQSRR